MDAVKRRVSQIARRIYRRSRLNQLLLKALGRERRKQIVGAWKKKLPVLPAICEDLEVWSAQHKDVERVLLSPGVSIERQPPRTIEPTLLDAFTKRLKTQIRPRYLYTLHDVTLTGANGLVILPDGAYAAESIYGTSHLVLDPMYLSPMETRPQEKAGEYFSLLGEFSNTANYFHWIHDGLLRLYGVDAELVAHVKFIVPPELRSYQMETLALLGIQSEQLVPFPPNSTWKIATLYFASLPVSGADYVDAEIWLREKLLAAADVTKRMPKRRLYLSRRFDLHGRIVNEEQVIGCLSQYGFETIYPGKMTVREQIALFAQAEVIVSGSNSGLMNLLFAPAGAKVLEILELTRAVRLGHVHWSMTEVLGQEFWYFIGETRANPEWSDRPDLYVPMDKLMQSLDKMRIGQRNTV